MTFPTTITSVIEDRDALAARVDELEAALRNLMDCSRAIVGAANDDGDADEAFDMYFAAQNRARSALHRKDTSQ